MLKNLPKLGLLLLLVTLCAAQQSSIQKEGNNWTKLVNGSLSGARNLHIRVQVGAVRVQGGSASGITYVIRNKSYESTEDRARRQFDSYKISTYTRGDTAWIVGEWEGGRPHKFSSDVTITVPRDIDLVKIETEDGEIVTTGISGRLEVESGAGTIHLDDIGGAINAQTGGGAIDVGTALAAGQFTLVRSRVKLLRKAAVETWSSYRVRRKRRCRPEAAAFVWTSALDS